ncbi:hypothetical protein, partial [uncultured Rikenella sp.]|uniref:hypothetical protein n=1 Tax=uncultured Rikenella sp. TaxID=368003 RepID=UPI00272B3DB7
MRSEVFLVLFVHNRRCQRVQCKRSLQIAKRRGGRRSQREQFQPVTKESQKTAHIYLPEPNIVL